MFNREGRGPATIGPEGQPVPLIDAVHTHKRNAGTLANTLRNLASAFYTTGNETMGDKLDDIADMILEDAAMVSDAFSANLDRDLRSAQQATGNMMKALVAGCVIGATSDDPEAFAKGAESLVEMFEEKPEKA